MSKMKVAFAGFRHGHIFVLHEMAAAHADYEIVDACEADVEAREAAATRGVAFTHTDYGEMLAATTAETVVIGSPFGERGGMAIAALRAGKNVICDKPLCTDLGELDEIEHLAREKGLFVSCMFTMRFEEKVAAVRAALATGALGRIQNVYFGGQHPLQYGRRPAWYFEEGKHGGVINDIAIHGVDLLSFLFSFETERIAAARAWNAYATAEPQFLDSAQLMLVGKGGEGVIADVSYAIPDGVEFALPHYWQFYIWGTEGAISFSLNGDVVLYRKGQAAGEILAPQKTTDYLSDFLALTRGETDVVLPMEEVFRSTRATLLIQRFADEGK